MYRRIRTTLDESRALPFEIKFEEMHGHSPRFLLINTALNIGVGHNDNDDMYTRQPAKFSFAEAPKATIPVAMEASKPLVTRIFPFAPVLPAGVKAYSCSGIVTKKGLDYLALTEQNAPEANTPYILYAPYGCDSEPLIGWGTACKPAYKNGYLTGVYEETEVPLGIYIFKDKADEGWDGWGFYKVISERSFIDCYQVYLTAPTSVGLVYFDMQEMGINGITDATNATLTVYDMLGRRVKSADGSPIKKGLYVVRKGNGVIQKVNMK